MVNFPARPENRAGFTLIEVLVTVTIIAALAAIIAPTLVNQLDRGETSQVSGDLTTVSGAVQTFRLDVAPSFPGDIGDLVVQPATDGSDLTLSGSSYSQSQVDRWDGPHLDLEGVVETNSSSTAFTTGYEGDVVNGLLEDDGSVVPGSTSGSWVVIRVTNLSSADIAEVDEQVDDNASTTGRYRFTTSLSQDTLYYLATRTGN